jgi:hypothetical protein
MRCLARTSIWCSYSSRSHSSNEASPTKEVRRCTDGDARKVNPEFLQHTARRARFHCARVPASQAFRWKTLVRPCCGRRRCHDAGRRVRAWMAMALTCDSGQVGAYTFERSRHQLLANVPGPCRNNSGVALQSHGNRLSSARSASCWDTLAAVRIVTAAITSARAIQTPTRIAPSTRLRTTRWQSELRYDTSVPPIARVGASADVTSQSSAKQYSRPAPPR